jgi:hypothetical protein
MNERENEIMNRKIENVTGSSSLEDLAMEKKADPEATEELNMIWGREEAVVEESPHLEYSSPEHESVATSHASDLDYDSSENEEDEEIEYDEDEDAAGEYRQKGMGMPKVVGLMVGTAVVSALATSLVLPYIYGSTPQDVFGRVGNAVPVTFETTRETQASEAPKIIKIKDDGTLNPVAAVAQKLQPSVVNIKITQSQNYMFNETSALAGTGSGVIYLSLIHI